MTGSTRSLWDTEAKTMLNRPPLPQSSSSSFSSSTSLQDQTPRIMRTTTRARTIEEVVRTRDRRPVGALPPVARFVTEAQKPRRWPGLLGTRYSRVSPRNYQPKRENLTSALARAIFALAASLRRSALRADAARASTNYFRAATVRTTNAHIHVS